MPRRPSSAASSVELMCSRLASTANYSPASIRTQRFSTLTVVSRLERGGRHTLPWEITAEDVAWLKAHMDGEGLTVSTRTGYISALRRWLAYYGNNVMDGMKFRAPADMRPNVDWLTAEQARALLALDKSPLDDLLVHCELCLGMRRIEVLRLTVDSFTDSYVDIVGKGSMGGKPRRVPLHRSSRAVLSRWMEARSRIVEKARSRRPTVAVPDKLLIYGRAGRIHPYSTKGTGIDAHMTALGTAIGYPRLSNHTLRRTFGRMMYRSGVPVATISKMLGHDSMDDTLKYLGVDMDDMVAAMKNFKL